MRRTAGRPPRRGWSRWPAGWDGRGCTSRAPPPLQAHDIVSDRMSRKDRQVLGRTAGAEVAHVAQARAASLRPLARIAAHKTRQHDTRSRGECKILSAAPEGSDRRGQRRLRFERLCDLILCGQQSNRDIVSQGCPERRDQGVGGRTAWLPHRRPQSCAPLVALGRKAFAPTARAARRVDLQSPAVGFDGSTGPGEDRAVS